MARSVLGSLILGYRPLWGRGRSLCGIELCISEADSNIAVDAAHLLRTLQEIWEPQSPPLLLAPQTRQLLCDLLEHAPPETPWIEVPDDWLGDSSVYQRVLEAQRRGLKLVWRGDVGRLPDASLARCFDNSLLSVPPQAAIQALKASPGASPILAGQMYEGIASRALMEHCLDEQQAHALIGWPTEDVLYSLRLQTPQPSHTVIYRLMKAIEAEQSLEAFEDILSEDPLLAYRFMTYTNSAALGLRTGVDSLRRGLVMMGYGSLLRWLSTQLPHASTEINLRPMREALVLRAKLSEQLIDAGVGIELRREVYLCALFSQIDDILGESLDSILHRIPLSERVFEAAAQGIGPYAPILQMARALEDCDAAVVRQLCEDHAMVLEDVNRTVLRVLAAQTMVRTLSSSSSS
ncbi:MAG: HDOD domain-containing protein [Giesbergeria sp.]|nr:HDOD domain-containing protein [Giesbergeria sp.]